MKPTSAYNLFSFLILICFICSFSCTPTKKVEEDNSLDKKKIIILLKSTTQPQQLEEAFKAYQLKSTGQVSRSENRFRFTYYKEGVDADELMKKIKASSMVVEAAYAPNMTTPKVNN